MRFLGIPLWSLHNAINIALYVVSDVVLRIRRTGNSDVPMACLYNPYNFNRVAEGGFCDPVRILLTVLRAWLNTLSVGSSCQY